MANEIILYTSDGCKRCDIIKMFLHSCNVPYREVTDKQIMLEKEFESVPMLECGDQVVQYESILQWLENNGYNVRGK